MSSFNMEDGTALFAINGYVQVVKRWLPEKLKVYMPLIPVLCGILYVFLVKPGGVTSLMDTISLGVMLGLSASGAYAGAKHVVENVGNEPPKA